jgi:hypothetical protein
VAIHQNVFKTPVDAGHTRTFLVQTRNFLPGDEHNARFQARNAFVRDQDAVVVTQLAPFHTPEQSGREFLVPADLPVARYRELLAAWADRGWCIDVDAQATRARREALVIPSPARRAEPHGWVHDPVPLRPAAQAAVAAGETTHAS